MSENPSASLTVIALRRLFEGIVASTRTLPHARARRGRIVVQRDIPYVAKADTAQKLDVIRASTGEDVRPALVYIHGGGFAVCSKETHEIITSAYASMGFTVFSINYRLMPEHPFPAPFHDACDALLWVLENGACYGADVSRLVIAGESAGGNLALGVCAAASMRDASDAKAAAVYDAAPSIVACAPACGLLQVSGIARLWRDVPQNKVGRWVWTRLQDLYLPHPSKFASPPIWADPLTVVETGALTRPLPPMFVLCGTADLLHLDSERLDAALTKRGVAHEFLSEPGGVHAYHALVWTEAAQRAWARQRRFLAERVPGIEDGPVILQ